MLTIIIGTSASGKTSFANKVFGLQNGIVSVTTREKRPGEVDGKDYYFLTKEQYDLLDNDGDLIEKTEYAGNKYGITFDEIEEKTEVAHSFVIVDIFGYYQMVDILKERNVEFETLYFVASLETVTKRLTGRGDSPEQIESRIKQYAIDSTNNAELLDNPEVLVIDANKELDKMIVQYFKERG